MIEAGQRVKFKRARVLVKRDGTKTTVDGVVAKVGDRFSVDTENGRRELIARVPFDGSTRQQRRAMERAKHGSA